MQNFGYLPGRLNKPENVDNYTNDRAHDEVEEKAQKHCIALLLEQETE